MEAWTMEVSCQMNFPSGAKPLGVRSVKSKLNEACSMAVNIPCMCAYSVYDVEVMPLRATDAGTTFCYNIKAVVGAVPNSLEKDNASVLLEMLRRPLAEVVEIKSLSANIQTFENENELLECDAKAFKCLKQHKNDFIKLRAEGSLFGHINKLVDGEKYRVSKSKRVEKKNNLELNKLVGLEEFKVIADDIVAAASIDKFRQENGLPPVNDGGLHMVFTGNPGTAKTTGARALGQLLSDKNLLKTGVFHEVGRADLVGKYIGETAPKVVSAFNRAEGGILFIDEAYSLAGDKKDFGAEAITTIVQEMENRRDRVMVIFAGYPDKMAEFLSKNEGLRSRILFNVNFPDYSTEELVEIFKQMAAAKGCVLPNETLEKVNAVCEHARQNTDFGNGRFVRNLLTKSILSQARRLLSDSAELTVENVKTIMACDIEYVDQEQPKHVVRKIGFNLTA